MINHVCEKRPEYFEFISSHFGVTFTEKSFTDPTLKVHALHEGTEIVAVLLIKKKKDNQYRITFIRVSEEFQGKRYGHAVLNIALHDAYNENKAPIKAFTRVKAQNIQSLNFFQAEGFKIDKFECLHDTVLENGNIVTELKPAYILNKDYNDNRI